MSMAAAPPDPDKPYRYLYVSGPKLKAAPKVDGVVNAEEWGGAGMAPRLYQIEEDRLTDLESKFYWGYTDEALYLAFQIQRPEEAIEPRAEIVERDQSFWRQDDGLELWLNVVPGPRPSPTLRDFYLMWNARGTHYDRRDADGNLQFNPDWQSVCRVVPGYGWEGEVRLPFREFVPMTAPKAGEEWRYVLMDNRATPSPQIGMSGWWPSPDWSYYAHEDTFTRLRFTGEDGVFVRVRESGLVRAPRKGGAVFEVVNPGPQPQKIAARLKLYRKKPDARSPLTYLRSFEQSRDKSRTSDGGKVLLMISDDQLSEAILADNYDLIQNKQEDLLLEGGTRQTLDFAGAEAVGDYLLLYDFRGPDDRVIAGGPLPFLIPEPLEVKFHRFILLDKSVMARIDLRYINGWTQECALEARLPQRRENWPAHKLGEKFDYKFSVQDWPPGEYPLQLLAQDAAGRTLAQRTAMFHIPETPKWFVEKAGLTPTVPEPWTPIRAASDKVSFVMGEYDLGVAALPRQVYVRSIYEEQKVPLLRGPIALRSPSLDWRSRPNTIREIRDDRVVVTGEAVAGNLQVTSEVTFEYDGMAKVVLAFQPIPSLKLDELTLEFPLRKEFSRLFLTGQTFQPTAAFKSAGALPLGEMKFPFLSSLWLGNEERGFRWFSENRKGWHVGQPFAGQAVELLNSPEGATLRLNLIKDDKPFLFNEPRTVTLGFMFTPPKPIRRDLVKLATVAPKESEARAGVTAMETWYFKNQGWPEVYDDAERAEKLELARQAHAVGLKVTPYSGWFLHRKSHVYALFGSEMVVEPLMDGGAGCDVCCWNTAVQDAYVGLLADRLRDIDLDGFRLDAGFSVDNCSSLLHGGYGSACGWFDEEGNLQPSKPLLAARRAAQRAYRLFHGGGKDNGFCIQHVHGSNRYDPILSHMDAVLSCEGIEMTMQSVEELPLDFYRANVMGDQHGYQVVYLPKSRAMGTDSFYGLSLLHNFLPRGMYPVAFQEVSYSRAAGSPREIWRAKDWIGPFDPGTEFWGYWKNAALLRTSSPHLVGSFHVRRGEKLLLGLMNLQRQPLEATVTLDLPALGFGANVYAFDPILQEPVALEGHSLKLTFFPEGYRCLQLASQPFPLFEPKKISRNLIPEAAPTRWPVGGSPAGWQSSKFVEENNPLPLSGADVRVPEGRIVLSSDGAATLRFLKHFSEPGKKYLLEGEATIECDNGAFLGEWPDESHFSVRLGDLYYGHRRTMTSQPPPGTTQKFRLYGEGPAVVEVAFRKAKGRAIIHKLELYEIEELPPGFLVGRYGQ